MCVYFQHVHVMVFIRYLQFIQVLAPMIHNRHAVYKPGCCDNPSDYTAG